MVAKRENETKQFEKFNLLENSDNEENVTYLYTTLLLNYTCQGSIQKPTNVSITEIKLLYDKYFD